MVASKVGGQAAKRLHGLYKRRWEGNQATTWPLHTSLGRHLGDCMAPFNIVGQAAEEPHGQFRHAVLQPYCQQQHCWRQAGPAKRQMAEGQRNRMARRKNGTLACLGATDAAHRKQECTWDNMWHKPGTCCHVLTMCCASCNMRRNRLPLLPCPCQYMARNGSEHDHTVRCFGLQHHMP